MTANKELAFQNSEKEKRAAELVIANNELLFQNEEKEKRAAELVIANKELAFQNAEKEKRAVELEAAETHLKAHIRGLEEMMFMISHRVRQPICNIMGVASTLHKLTNSPEELLRSVTYIEAATQKLDILTRELTAFISDLEKKGKTQI